MKAFSISIPFFVIVCLFPCVSHAQSSDSLLVQLSRKWTNAKTYVIKMAELMPADHYSFKPAPEVMSFQEQLMHIADNMLWLSSAFLYGNDTGKRKPDTAQVDKPGVLKKLSAAYDQALLAHHKLNKDDLNKTVPFFAGPMTRRQILILMHDHQTHHVGQLILYLRLNGIVPPAYIGW